MMKPYLAFFVIFLTAFTLGYITPDPQEIAECEPIIDVIAEPNFPTYRNSTSIDPPTNPDTPALRGTLDLHAENGDLDAQHSRRLGGSASLYFNVAKFAFSILDDRLDITGSLFDLIGLPSSGPDLGE